jgi:uncharacterized membrane protein
MTPRGVERSRRDKGRAGSLLRREPALILGAAIAGVAYAAFSIARHAGFGSGGFDLAIFGQAVWHYSRFEAPASTILVPLVEPAASSSRVFPSVLGDHFSPILAALAPLYWIWGDVRMLLAAQGLLIAASALPVFLHARAQIGRGPAYPLTAAYLLFWGILSAVEYDFHEVAFAPLFIAAAILFAERERWLPFAVAVALLLLTKEDLAIVVVAMGVYLLVRRRLRPAAATIGVGIGWYLLSTRVLIPHFSGGLPFRHWTYDSLGRNLPELTAKALRDPLDVLSRFAVPTTKLETLVYLVAPWLGLCLLSPLILLALPMVAERLLSDKALLWTRYFHYSLALAPVLAMAAANGLARVARLAQRWVGPSGEGWLRPSVVTLTLAVGMLLVSVALSSQWPQFQALTRLSFRSSTNAQRVDLRPGATRDAARAVAAVPAHEGSVATQARLLPHLSARAQIYLLGPGVPRTDYIVLERGGSPFPFRRPAVDRLLASRRAEYRVAFSAGRYVVFERSTTPP